jgi:hypothetical protein
MEFYSAIKKNEVLSFAGKWMALANIILSKVSHAQKAKNHFLPQMKIVDQKKKCSNVIGHGSHTKGRMYTEGIGKGKET